MPKVFVLVRTYLSPNLPPAVPIPVISARYGTCPYAFFFTAVRHNYKRGAVAVGLQNPSALARNRRIREVCDARSVKREALRRYVSRQNAFGQLFKNRAAFVEPYGEVPEQVYRLEDSSCS